jgi:phage-related baseplate assembly protein
MNNVDLTQLPAPVVIQQKSYDEILSEMLADLQARANIDLSPADPSYKVLEVAAYREYLLRQEFNDRAKGLLLAYAKGGDLDHLGVTYFETQRLVIDPGNPNAIPPVAPIYESDADYLQRMMLAGDAYSTAGAEPAYVYYALSASGLIKQVLPSSPTPGQVALTILTREGSGVPTPEIIAAVETALSNAVRPLTDEVVVQPPTILNYTVNATITVYPGMNHAYVRQLSEDSATAWAASQHLIGRDVTVAGYIAALKVAGVHDVVLNNTVGTDLVANLPVTDTQAGYCTGITVAVGGEGG